MTHPTAAELHHRYGMDMPASKGQPVLQGHADFCAAHGHATWTVDGKPQGTCPRCGEVTTPAPVQHPTLSAAALPVGALVYPIAGRPEDARRLSSVTDLGGPTVALHFVGTAAGRPAPVEVHAGDPWHVIPGSATQAVAEPVTPAVAELVELVEQNIGVDRLVSDAADFFTDPGGVLGYLSGPGEYSHEDAREAFRVVARKHADDFDDSGEAARHYLATGQAWVPSVGRAGRLVADIERMAQSKASSNSPWTALERAAVELAELVKSRV